MKICKVLFLLLAPMLWACTDENELPKYYSGTAQALKNGEPWNAHVVFEAYPSNQNKFFNAVMDVLDKGNFPKESIGVSKIKKNLDPQKIYYANISDRTDSLHAFYSTLVTGGGDVLGHFYELDSAAIHQDGDIVNWFQITSYNSKRSEIEGVFDILFNIIIESKEDPNPPQKIHFTDGKFKVKVSKEWFD